MQVHFHNLLKYSRLHVITYLDIHDSAATRISLFEYWKL